MPFDLFNWDAGNVGHIAEHEVEPVETEELLLGDPLDIGFDVVDGEERWSFLGETSQGRILRVVITLRGELIRVVTAFEPDKRGKMFYLEWKASQTWPT
jgi:uncharacterized DUF497 family protein